MLKKLSCIILFVCITSLVALPIHAQDVEDTVPNQSESIEADDHHQLPIWVVIVGAILAVASVGGAYAYFRQSYTGLDYAVVLAMAMTGFIHITIGLLGDDLLFLNGAGFVILACVRFIPQLQGRRIIIGLLNIAVIIYTGITIYGYFDTHITYDAVGIVTKIVEIIAIGLLMMHLIKQVKPTAIQS